MRRQALSSRRKAQALSLRRRAQGMPVNLIVVGALAVMVLVVVALMLQTQFADTFAKLFGFSAAATPTGNEIRKSNCNQYCQRLPGGITCPEFKYSMYCTARWNTVIENDHCWKDDMDGEEIIIHCTAGKWSDEGELNNCKECPGER